MKQKKYSVLYPYEFIYPIAFCIAISGLILYFYFRLINGGSNGVRESSLGDLFPIPILMVLAIFILLYMGCRWVRYDDSGVYYKDLKNYYFIPWEKIKYVKLTVNNWEKIGKGSYIVISTDSYALQNTDFRASRDGFIVMKYRISALDIIKKYYKGDIVRGVSKK